MAKWGLAALAAAATLVAGCSQDQVVDTGEFPRTPVPSTTTVVPTPVNNADLVNAFDFFVDTEGVKGYYFTTPSESWNCMITARISVGCQTADGSGLGIPGAPETLPGPDGELVAPNAIVVNVNGDAFFAAVPTDAYLPPSGTPKVLEFNKILAAAAFQCNVQEEVGVSCLSELSEKGFTFSADAFSLAYTKLPG